MRSFNYDVHFERINNMLVCKLCKKEFKSVKSYNLKLHLEKIHKLNFQESDYIQLKTYKKKNIKCEISKKLLIKSYIGNRI